MASTREDNEVAPLQAGVFEICRLRENSLCALKHLLKLPRNLWPVVIRWRGFLRLGWWCPRRVAGVALSRGLNLAEKILNTLGHRPAPHNGYVAMIFEMSSPPLQWTPIFIVDPEVPNILVQPKLSRQLQECGVHLWSRVPSLRANITPKSKREQEVTADGRGNSGLPSRSRGHHFARPINRVFENCNHDVSSDQKGMTSSNASRSATAGLR